MPLYADESVHGLDSLEHLAQQGAFAGVNIKLDKTGGLTEALAMVAAAHARGFGIMVGSMVGTSLAMAPAMLLTPRANFVDLDGPCSWPRIAPTDWSTRAASSCRRASPFGADIGADSRRIRPETQGAKGHPIRVRENLDTSG